MSSPHRDVWITRTGVSNLRIDHEPPRFQTLPLVMHRHLVIGGGVSGLTVASELHRRGADVLLLESAPELGGAVRSERIGDYLVDHGADMFAIDPPAAWQMCQTLGFADQAIAPQVHRRGAMIWSRGRMHRIPRGFVLMRATATWPILRSSILTWRGKTRFLMERFVRKPTVGVDGTVPEESVAEFASRRMGTEVLERLVTPLVAGIYTADIAQLSMSAAMAPVLGLESKHGSLAAAAIEQRRTERRQRKARSRLDDDKRLGGDSKAGGNDGLGNEAENRQTAGARYGRFRSFPDGMAGLVRRLAETLPADRIRTSAGVKSLRRDAEQWTVETESDTVQAEQITLAIPPPAAADLVRPWDVTLADAWTAIPSASAAIVCIGVGDEQIERPIDAFGFVVPPREGSPLIAASMSSYKFDGRAPAGQTLIRCFMGGMLDPDRVNDCDDVLIDTAMRCLGEMIGLRGEPVMTRVVRWRSAMPQYNVGHDNRIASIQRRLATHPGLTWTNNASGGVGIAPTIASAIRLADSLLDD